MEFSDLGDLSGLGKKIRRAIKRFFPRDDDPFFLTIFNLQDSRVKYHYVSNGERTQVIKMLEEFLADQKSRMN